MGNVLTFAALQEAVEYLRSVVSEWENARSDAASMVNWRGSPRRAITSDIEQAAQQLCELVFDAEFENSPKCHSLVLAIDAFDEAFATYAENCLRAPDRTDPSGGPELWGPYHRMLEACHPKGYPKPEPIGALLVGKVSHQQIAKIYGWRTPDGALDVDKVQQEITEPGKHYQPANWVHPSELRAQAEIEQRWQLRQAVRPSRRATRSAPAERMHRESPETLDELITSGINVTQIAKMKRVSEDAVRERAATLGVPLDGSVLATAAAMSRRASPSAEEEEIALRAEELRLAGLRDFSELGADKDARIAALHADGRKPRDIVKMLGNAFPGLSYQDVVYVIEKTKQAVAAK